MNCIYLLLLLCCCGCNSFRACEFVQTVRQRDCGCQDEREDRRRDRSEEGRESCEEKRNGDNRASRPFRDIRTEPPGMCPDSRNRNESLPRPFPPFTDGPGCGCGNG